MNQAETMAALRNVPLFRELDEPDLLEVARLVWMRTYPADTALFHAGDPGHMLYVILAGQVRIEKVSATGDTVHLAYRGRGDHIGELALIDGKPRMASALTVGECRCLTMEREAFQKCLQNAPCLALSLMAALAGRLREAAADLEGVQELDVLGRLCKALLELAADYGQEDDGTVKIARRITHQDLADRIGATRESVTRAFSSLRQTGLARTSGRTLFLLDLEALRRRSAI